MYLQNVNIPPLGFIPGASSIHNQFTGHGPDAGSLQKGTDQDTLTPERYSGTLAFMWESDKVWTPTEHAYGLREKEYKACWQSLGSRFDPNYVYLITYSLHYTYHIL